MNATYAVQPVSGPIQATIRPPGSKSITNRALVCAALAEGQSVLSGVLHSDDTRVMIDGLNQLGVRVRESEPHVLQVAGCGGRIPAAEADLLIGNSGTTVRFLTALTTLGHGVFRLDGTPRMRERPIGDLADALNALGGRVECESPGRCPPVVVNAAGLPGGMASVRGGISSQFLSALLMAAPCAQGAITLAVDGELVSKPYIGMTLAVMDAFGASVDAGAALQQFSIVPAGYRGREYQVEPDASAASYFWAAAAITGGRVAVEGLSRNSLQGDVQFVHCLAKMGCTVQEGPDSITVVGGPLRGAEVNMNAISDTAQTLAAVALYAEGPTTITGIGHNRHKETDRIGDLATELRKVGARVDELADGLRITPGELRPALLDTYDDHRMAMSLSLVGLRQQGVVIKDPGCTSKTYPGYFEDLQLVCGLA